MVKFVRSHFAQKPQHVSVGDKMTKVRPPVSTMVPQAVEEAADIQTRGSTWTNGASDDQSQSPISTCETGGIGNWTDATATGGYMEEDSCKKIVDTINSEVSPAGYWTVTNNDGDPFVELRSTQGKCYCSVARVDGHSGRFK